MTSLVEADYFTSSVKMAELAEHEEKLLHGLRAHAKSLLKYVVHFTIHKFLTCGASRHERCHVWRWLTELFHAFSLNCFDGTITQAIERLAHTIVPGNNFLFSVKGQETYEYSAAPFSTKFSSPLAWAPNTSRLYLLLQEQLFWSVKLPLHSVHVALVGWRKSKLNQIV